MKKILTLLMIMIQLMFMMGSVRGDITEVDKKVADYLISWQLDNGGWSKNMPEMFTRPWDGKENKGRYYKVDKVTPLSTIDNNATVQQLNYIAAAYQLDREKAYKTSFLKGIDFLMKMQYPTGGFPQVYPIQDHATALYENDATFNDNATSNVLNLFMDIIEYKPPYDDQNLISKELYRKVKRSLDSGIVYILKSQITVNGKLTAWGGQHDPVTYATTHGRSFEPISIISKESVGLIKVLERYDNGSPKIQISIQAARQWFIDSVVLDTQYILKGSDGKYFIPKSGKYSWYRFYEIGTNQPMFADKDGTITHDITQISEERRHGYGWAGDWGKTIYIDYLIAQGEIVDEELPADLPEAEFDEDLLEVQSDEELYQESLDNLINQLPLKGIVIGSLSVFGIGLIGLILHRRKQ